MGKVNISEPRIFSNSMSLQCYFKELRDTKNLSHDEQTALAKKAREGDQKAIDLMVTSNLKFVVSIVKGYAGRGFSSEDLISEGNYGLVKAIHRFDETKGYRFITYAVWWIRQAILQYMYENSNMVRIPASKINAIKKINSATDQLSKSLDREPTNQEIEALTDMTREEISNTFLDLHSTVSLDMKLDTDSDSGSLIDIIPGETLDDIESGINTEELREEVKKIMTKLSPREKEILNMFYGLNGKNQASLQEIGEKFSMTNERIRQLKEGALKKLRNHSKMRQIQAFRNTVLAG